MSGEEAGGVTDLKSPSTSRWPVLSAPTMRMSCVRGATLTHFSTRGHLFPRPPYPHVAGRPTGMRPARFEAPTGWAFRQLADTQVPRRLDGRRRYAGDRDPSDSRVAAICTGIRAQRVVLARRRCGHKVVEVLPRPRRPNSARILGGRERRADTIQGDFPWSFGVT